MNQCVLLSFPTILIDLSQPTPKTENTLMLAVIAGLMQHSLLQLGFGMQDDICVDSQLLVVHVQNRMILLIACGIDATSNVVLLAWALVPIEDEIWWNWFLTYLKATYSVILY